MTHELPIAHDVLAAEPRRSLIARQTAEFLARGGEVRVVGTTVLPAERVAKVAPTQKVCRSCLRKLPASMFSAHTTVDGLRPDCRHCVTARRVLRAQEV